MGAVGLNPGINFLQQIRWIAHVKLPEVPAFCASSFVVCFEVRKPPPQAGTLRGVFV